MIVRPLTTFMAVNQANIQAVTALEMNQGREEHLIWQPGFGQRFLVACVTFAAVSVVAPPSVSGTRIWRPVLQRAAGRIDSWILLGLASSSCCALQLIINATMAIGCAGFNTVLGPLRPIFLGISVVLQGHLWKAAINARTYAQAAVATTICTVLSFLPEALYYWVHRLDAWQGSTEVEQGVVTLQIGGMGCTACTQKVLSALKGVEGIDKSEVDLEKGLAWVKMDEGKGDAGTLEQAVQAVRETGFSCDAIIQE